MSNTGSEDTTRSDWEDKLLDHMFGALSPEESARFDQDLLECRSRLDMAKSYQEVVGLLGTAVPAAEPPVGHKTRLMALIAATPQEASGLDTAPSAAGQARRPDLTLLPGSSPREAVAAQPSARVPDAAPALARARAAQRWAYAAAGLAAALALFFGVFALMQSTARDNEFNIPPGYQVQAILPQETYTMTAVAIFNPNTQDTTIYASNLQPLSPDQVYELWLLPSQGDPVAAGTFREDTSGRATHKHVADRPLQNYAGFAVTIERAPGGSTPGGPIVTLGQYR